MLAAILVYDIIMQRVTVLQILHGIAAALLGKNVALNETSIALIGLLLHYLITFCFTVFYFLLFTHGSFLKRNTLFSGLLYGIFVWFIMNIIVVPAATGNHYTFLWPAFLRQVITLIICIGFPIAFLTDKYYSERN